MASISLANDRFRNLLHDLTRPHPEIRSVAHRQQMRLVSYLTLTLTMVGAAAWVFGLLTAPETPNSASQVFNGLGVLAGFGVYRLSRTRHYLATAWLLIGLVAVTVISPYLLNDNPIALYFLTLVLLLGAALLSLREMAALTAACVAVIVAGALLRGGMTQHNLYANAITLIVMTAAVVWVTSSHRDRLETERRQELEAANGALQEREAELQTLVERLRESEASVRASAEEQARLQEQVIAAQQQALKELSTPVIPVAQGVIALPLVGAIDTARARDVTRALLGGITRHRADVAILDITGVPVVDTGVAQHLSQAIAAARLKGAHTIVSGVSDAVAEAIVDLGIDWSDVETVFDLQTALRHALERAAA